MSDLFKVISVEYWVDPGTDQARHVNKATSGAEPVRRESKKWYARVPGKRNPVPLSENKAVARQSKGDCPSDTPAGASHDRSSCIHSSLSIQIFPVLSTLV